MRPHIQISPGYLKSIQSGISEVINIISSKENGIDDKDVEAIEKLTKLWKFCERDVVKELYKSLLKNSITSSENSPSNR